MQMWMSYLPMCWIKILKFKVSPHWFICSSFKYCLRFLENIYWQRRYRKAAIFDCIFEAKQKVYCKGTERREKLRIFALHDSQNGYKSVNKEESFGTQPIKTHLLVKAGSRWKARSRRYNWKLHQVQKNKIIKFEKIIYRKSSNYRPPHFQSWKI